MRFTAYAAASALAAMATAQTFTDCNPTQKECPNDPALPVIFMTDFKAGTGAIKGWKVTSAGGVSYGAGGAEFTITGKDQAPTIQTEGFLQFGYVEVKARAAKGQGIISSIVLQSQALDEIDWEWIGGQEGKVQMNYFGKGNTTTYDRMIEAPVANTQTETHTYALNWTADALTWLLDGTPVRTLHYADANGGKTFPQTPCNVRLGNWAGGDAPNAGTVEWAGGKVDYTHAPFTMVVESVKVVNYSPGTAYKWTDKSGTHESIQVIGNPNGADIDAPASKPHNSARADTTCTTGAGSAKTSVAPVRHEQSGFAFPTGSLSAPPKNSSEACACGTVTLTVTGPPPAATFTTEFPAITPTNLPVPVVSSVRNSPPPYPTSGIMKETRPAPVVPGPTAPSAVIPLVPSAVIPLVPSRSASVSASAAPQFTGAAGQNRVGVLGGVVAGVVLFAL